MEKTDRFVRHATRKTLASPRKIEGKIAIVAGNGELPAHVYEALIAKGKTPVLIGVDREISSKLAAKADAVLTFGQVGKLFKIIEDENVGWITFAGGIKKRPDFKSLKLDVLTIKELPNLLRIVMGGDNSVLSKISKYFEAKDIHVVGSHELAPELLAGKGLIVGKIAKKTEMSIITQGIIAAKTIGDLDVGQAAVTEDGRTIALEGLEGTDLMLQRVKMLREIGRLTSKPKFGVLVKAMKPNQDMRADLPAIGPDTIKTVIEAGLKGIAIEAARSLILHREETLELAKKHKLFIYGFEKSEGQ